VATGSIAALVAAATSRDGVALSCALAASANLIAAIHYRMICESFGTRPFAPKRARLQANKWARACTGTVRQEQADDEAARACDDVTVDNYRYSDWLVTLPIMTLDLFKLAGDVNGGVQPLPNVAVVNEYTLSAIMAVMVVFGTAYQRLSTGDLAVLNKPTSSLLSAACFLCAMAIFVFVLVALNQDLHIGSCAEHTSCTSARRAELRAEQIAVRVLSFVWCGYPVVSLVATLCSLWAGAGSKVSLFKDAAYGALDAASKGGLALFAALRLRS